MNLINQLCKQLFCKHEWVHVSNIYGDMIRYTGWKRSVWKCKKCGRLKYKENLYYGDKINLNL